MELNTALAVIEYFRDRYENSSSLIHETPIERALHAQARITISESVRQLIGEQNAESHGRSPSIRPENQVR